MKSLVSTLINLFCALLLVAAAYFLTLKDQKKNQPVENLSQYALILQKHLSQYGPPERIEFNNLTERFKNEAESLKKIKIPMRPDSKFYISIDVFTDETDLEAPLVAQIQFFDKATENKVKEDVINLE